MKLFLLLLIALSVIHTAVAATAPYWIAQDANGDDLDDKKCPHDGTRLFKSVSLGPDDINLCYEQCRSIQNCKHISWGHANGAWNCMGCNGHQSGYDRHAGFKIYEIKTRNDWAFTKVQAKADCALQSSESISGVLTQEQCHTKCKDTKGCGYFSVSDMGFNPTGSGTCHLCKHADGFRTSDLSNTYSVLSPADYKPVCEGPTGVVWGDPHLITFDKLRYDCQGRGEFVLVKSNGADPLAIHGVFKDTGGSATGPSVTRSVAILVDEDVPVLQITIPDMPVNGKCEFSYTLGDQETSIPADEIVEFFMKNYPGQANVYTNEKAVIVTFPDYQTRIEILTHSGRFSTFGCRMRANVCVTPSNHGGEGNIVGLFGSPNNSKTDDWMMNDIAKTQVSIPVNDKWKLVKEGTDHCRANWCVPRANTLFSDSTYTAHNKCADDSFDPEAYKNAIDALTEDIVKLCKEKTENPDECMADIGVAKTLDNNLNLEDLITEFSEEEVDSNKVTTTSEAELYAEDDWNSPNVTTLSIATGNGGANGDPHFKTWKNEHFEFHGQCDMVLARDPEFAGDVGLEVQIRTKLVRFWSYIKTAAILIGNDILEIEGSPDPDDHETHYWFNYEYEGDAPTIGGFPLSITRRSFQKRFFEIDLGSKFPGQKIVISTFREFVAVEFVNASEEAFGKSVGILGDFKTGDTLARDGFSVIDDFTKLGNEWQVHPEEPRLFREIAEPQFPRKCLAPEDPRGERRRRLGESTISVEDAEAACSRVVKDSLDMKDCVYDILATQDLDMVGAF